MSGKILDKILNMFYVRISKEAIMTLKCIRESLGENYNLGFYIRTLRIEEKIKGSELAAKLGISRQELLQIEKNQTVLSPKRAKEIAELMGVSPRLFVELAVSDLLKRQGIEEFESVKIKFKKKER